MPRSPARPNPDRECSHYPPQVPWRDRPFLQLKIAAEIIGVSPASLYRFHSEGRLHLRELGGRTLVDTKSLIALIDDAKEWTPKPRGLEARASRKKAL